VLHIVLIIIFEDLNLTMHHSSSAMGADVFAVHALSMQSSAGLI